MALKALKIENNVAAASKANERKLAKSQLIISAGGNNGVWRQWRQSQWRHQAAKGEKRNNAESEKKSWRKSRQRIGREKREMRAARITNAPKRAALAANAENERNVVSLAKNNGVK
jgi:hypothetical protein